MDFFDFIKPEELDDLPEDPHVAFIAFVRLAEPRLSARLREIGPRDQDTYEQIDDARYGFQNLVLGAAKKFGVEPFASLEMPTLKNHSDENYRQFRADLTHYLTQVMLTVAIRDRSDSVPLPPKSADSIRQYVHYLREAIDKADHLTKARKAALHRRLDALIEELDRKRVRYLLVARVVIEILAIPGALQASYDVMAPLAAKILREIGEAKLADDDEKRIPFEGPVALSPPRQPSVKPSANFARDEMDDEIPF